MVAEPILVSGPPGTIHRPPSGNSSDQDNVDSAGEGTPAISLQATGVTSDRLVSIRQALLGKGFTADAAQRISRTSTDSVYDARWKKWFFWCREHGVDPSDPSTPDVTSFLLYLWDLGLAPGTIRGYRPALRSVFLHVGCHVFDNPEIAALLKNLALERPIQHKEVPLWNLPL